MELTDDEIETVKSLIKDWGFEYGLITDRTKLIQLAIKIGLGKQWAEDNFELAQ